MYIFDYYIKTLKDLRIYYKCPSNIMDSVLPCDGRRVGSIPTLGLNFNNF